MDPVFSLPLGRDVLHRGLRAVDSGAGQFDNVDPDILNQIFDFMVRDFARFALQIYGMHNTKDEQRAYCKEIMLIRRGGDDAQYRRVWDGVVLPLNGEYAMNE